MNSEALSAAFLGLAKAGKDGGLQVSDGGCKDFIILADDHAFEVNFAEAHCSNFKMTWNGKSFCRFQYLNSYSIQYATSF
jgi:hypothetical protein